MVRLFRSCIGLLVFAITAAFSIGLPPASLADDDANVNVAAYAHKPEVMLNTGAATYSVPIQVPPGRRGMTPKLAFTYSSYRGNGWLGMGWDISVGEIVRTNDPLIDYAADEFEIRSPAVNDKLAPYSSYYREKSDTTFTRYHNPDPNNSGWTVEYRDGRIAYYGTTPDSREYNDLGIFRWRLERIEDPHKNSIVYSYERDNGRLYLSAIRYVETDSGYLNEIRFVSGIDRLDPILSHASGSPFMMAKLLGNINVEQDGVRIRRYTCSYESSQYPGDRSRLKSITISAREAPDSGRPEKALPPIEFGYTDSVSGFGDDITLEFEEAIISNDVIAGIPHFAEVDGDGCTDLLIKEKKEDGSELHFYKAQADGSFSFVNTLSIGTSSFWIQDYDGDGKIDLQMRAGDHLDLYDLNCHLLTSHISVASEPKKSYGPFSGLGEGNKRSHFLDIDNDRHLDVVMSTRSGDTTTVEAWLYEPETDSIERSFREIHINSPGHAQFKDVNGDGIVDFYLNSRGIFLGQGNGDFKKTSSFDFGFSRILSTGDINGDGLMDVTADNGNKVDIYIADGRGGLIKIRDRMNIDSDCDGMSLFDINGDGLADIVQTEPGTRSILTFLSTGDENFTQLKRTEGIDLDRSLPSKNAFADINGDGRLDVIVCNKDEDEDDDTDTDTMTVSTYLAEGEGKVNLLNQVDNGQGTTITLAYGASEQYRTWAPFHLVPISSRTIRDQFAKPVDAVTTYNYRTGRYDPLQREFLGFKYAKITRPDGSQISRSYYQDHFRKGIVSGESVAGHIGKSFKYLWRRSNTWSAPSADENSGSVQLAKQVTNRQGIEVTKEITPHPLCGLPETIVVSVGLADTKTPPGYDPDLFNHYSKTTNQYAYYGGNTWRWRKSAETLTDADGNILRQKIFNNDNSEIWTSSLRNVITMERRHRFIPASIMITTGT